MDGWMDGELNGRHGGNSPDGWKDGELKKNSSMDKWMKS